jgi:hypothetical protein
MITVGSAPRLEHDLDRAVGPALEHLVRRRSIGERQPVSSKVVHAERVIVGQKGQDVRDPQMLVLVTLMFASFGSLITGSTTSSTWMSRKPCQVTAFILVLHLAPELTGQMRAGLRAHLQHAVVRAHSAADMLSLQR